MPTWFICMDVTTGDNTNLAQQETLNSLVVGGIQNLQIDSGEQ